MVRLQYAFPCMAGNRGVKSADWHENLPTELRYKLERMMIKNMKMHENVQREISSLRISRMFATFPFAIFNFLVFHTNGKLELDSA